MQWLTTALDMLFPPRPTQVRVRTATLSSLASHIQPTPVEQTSLLLTSLLPYREPLVQALIIETKYHAGTKAQQLLGTVLADYLCEWCADEQGFETREFILVPLPLSKARMRKRGYNQVEKVCRAACARENAPYRLRTDILERVRDTAPQTTLKRAERLQNMHDAFAVLRGALPLDRSTTYILVDDVVTTGATLAAACAALESAGAASIAALALAH